MKTVNLSKIFEDGKKIFSRIVKAMSRPAVAGLPAQIAFYFLWSLIPLVITVSVVTGFFNFANEQIIFFLESQSIGSLNDVLLPYFQDNYVENFNFLVIIIPIFLGSKSFNTLINVTEVMYGHEARNPLFKRLYACLLMIAFIFLLVFLIFIPTFGARIMTFVFHLLSLDDIFLKMVVWIRWPLSLIVIYTGVLSIYYATLEFKVSAKKLVVGSLVTTLGWTIASIFFDFYFASIADFSIYGNFANIVVLFFWFFNLAYIFVLGVAVNIAFDDNVELK